jgi:excisionase family DNA binding protein
MKTTSPPSEPQRLLHDIDETAASLAVSTRTIHRWMKKGIIPFHKIGGALRFDLGEVKRALKLDAPQVPTEFQSLVKDYRMTEADVCELARFIRDEPAEAQAVLAQLRRHHHGAEREAHAEPYRTESEVVE